MSAQRRRPVDPTLVVYESFAGNGMLCNPEAVYRVLRSDPRFSHLRHVWVLDDLERHPQVMRELDGEERVTVVRRRSARYFRALSTAGYLVNNATFPAEFGKRPGQVYLNTWHGTPIKRMGYDIPGGATEARNVVRNLLQADFLASASPFMTEQLYATAYKMRGILPGVVVEEGYPRIDRQVVTDAREAREDLARRGLALGPQRVVLYAPTWRGDSFRTPRDDSAVVAERVERLVRRLGNGWTVLVKSHQADYAAARQLPGLQRALVDNDIPTNLLLAACDVLVADYSSIVVDFLTLDRPIVLFTPDQDEYDEVRGRYQPAPGWPGPVLTDIDAVAEAVAAAGSGRPEDPGMTHQLTRRAWRDLLCPYEDGRAAERLVDVVFADNRDGHTLVDLAVDGRRSVVIYVGELKPNGMTTSALNLLGALDHSRYDVTAVYAHTADPEQAAAVSSIDPEVRVVARFGAINGSRASQVVRHAVQRWGARGSSGPPPLQAMFRAEWERCLGQARFDSAVDFIGYGPFMALLLLHGRAGHRSIWMHNDMVADSRRVVGGRHPLRRRLEATFTLYRHFDSLVSVSESLRDVNRTRLAGYAPADRFAFAANLVDAGAVRRRAGLAPDWRAPDAPIGTVTFIASGRLSHAKNFPRLVSAYAMIRDEFPQARVVILGDGPDRAALAEHIDSLGVGQGVLLAGHQSNPFPVMASGDCFIMTSDHEGQPMVILEALALGLPVVTTRFESVESALPAGQGLIVPRTVSGVAEGMRAFLRGEVPAPAFDVEGYNRNAMEEFLAATGLAEGR